MAATPYRPINWAPNEIITEDKMDQMANNVQWIKENKPDALYTLPGGTKRYTGVKIAGGRVMIPPHPKTDTATATIRFGDFFTNRCQPIITTGILSNHIMTFCITNGINGLIPDNTGFEIHAKYFSDGKKKSTIGKSFYIQWQALGY
jgi:hypothetical protein